MTEEFIDEPVEFIDSAESVDKMFAATRTEGMHEAATAVRLFAAKPEGRHERLAFALVGPDAVAIGTLITRYVDALATHAEISSAEQAETA